MADAMTTAFRPYLMSRIREHDYPALDDSVLDAAVTTLEAELSELLAQPARLQRRSPLEVLQGACAGPNQALAESEIEPPARDPMASQALPGDIYDLAPASSSELGETVWQAHLAWGLAKAAEMKQPVAVLLTGNLLDRSRLEPIFGSHGLVLRTTDDLADFEKLLAGAPIQVVIDLSHPAAEKAITAAGDTRVIAFGPHVDEEAMARARMLGADQVLTRSSFFRQTGWMVGGSV